MTQIQSFKGLFIDDLKRAQNMEKKMNSEQIQETTRNAVIPFNTNSCFLQSSNTLDKSVNMYQ